MRLVLVLLASAFLAACGGGGDSAAVPPQGDPAPTAPADPPEDPRVCSIDGQRLSVRGYMETNYFWATQRGTPDKSATSMDAYFQSILYKPVDRFSYTEPTAQFNQFFTEGRRTGYGYTLTWSDTAQTQLRVRNVEPQSPVARAGLKRGDTIVSIDGFTPQQVAAGQPAQVTATGVVRAFVVKDLAGVQRQFTARSEDFPLSPVTSRKVFDVAGAGGARKVGYLAYHQFVGYSMLELGEAFRDFGAQGINELILDLRYNGGGSVSVSRDLATLIGGPRTQGQLYTYLRFAASQSASNQSFRFLANADFLPANPLPGLSRVIVIASPNTASASELVINGLKPYMGVVLVGATTYGKPYGFSPRDYCGTTYNAVEFEALNALGVGGYTAGFAPDCAAADDLAHELGDPAETRIRTALDYVRTGSCPAQSPQSAALRSAPETAFGETARPRMLAN